MSIFRRQWRSVFVQERAGIRGIERRVMGRAITAWPETAVLGGHVEQCEIDGAYLQHASLTNRAARTSQMPG